MDPHAHDAPKLLPPVGRSAAPLGPTLGCSDDSDDSDDSDAAATARSDDPSTLGDDRAGHVHCGDDVCDFGIETDGVCCYEDDAQGQCMSPREDCGGDFHGFGCDGPEDCEDGDRCCNYDQPRTGSCQATCGTSGTICHTQADCLSFEHCEPITTASLGYAHCVSDEVRETPGFEGKGVFCGDDETACAEGEVCCVTGAGSTCRSACEDDELTRRCDGPEDCTAPEECAIEYGSTRCIDATGMPTDGEPFVCHDYEDCSGYGCEPREGAPLLGFCNPHTGT